MQVLKRAKELLERGKYTCVFVMGEREFFSKERGVKPLLEIVNSDMDTINAYVADKVVGKAAAFLYQIMQIKALYAGTISTPALEVLKESGIYVEYGVLTSSIRNRANTGNCPMESAVWDVTDARLAREILEDKVKEGGL